MSLSCPRSARFRWLVLLLAEFGADVIRVDRLAGGSNLGETLARSPLGRGRKSVSIDLRVPEGRPLPAVWRARVTR